MLEADQAPGRLPINVSGVVAGQLGLDRGMARGLWLRTEHKAQGPV